MDSDDISTTKSKSKKGIESYNCVIKNDIDGLIKSLAEDVDGITYKDDRGGDTSLHKAAFLGFPECVDILLKNGAIVDEENDNKSTPLIKASFAGHSKCIELLLDAGADINKCNDAKDTALIGASWIGNDECINLLIKRGANKTVVDALGQDYLAIQKKKKEEFKAQVLIKARALGLSDILYAQFQSIKIEDMENHHKELKQSKKSNNSRKETAQQIEQAIITWKENFVKLHLDTFLPKDYNAKGIKDKVSMFSKENETFSKTIDTADLDFLDKVDVFKRYHVDVLYDKGIREDMQKVKLLQISQARKDILVKELNAILDKHGLTILYYATYINIKVEDTQTYVEQLKKDNTDNDKLIQFKKILDDFLKQYKLYELEYASPDILKELNLIQKKEYFLKELKKYVTTITDTTMKKNCKKFISDVESMSLLSLDSPSSPTKPSIVTTSIDVNINDDSNNYDDNSIIAPTPPTMQPPSFASPKKQSQTKAVDNVIITEVVETDAFDEIVSGLNEELDYVENVEYDEDFVAEAEEEEIRAPESA